VEALSYPVYPFYKIALEVDYSDWIFMAMDQLLGRETGSIFNDEAAAVAPVPVQAVKDIENSRSENRL
jgi:hypothetical protein